MKVLTRNIRGLGQASKKDAVRAFTHKLSPTILALLETKLLDLDLQLIHQVWGRRTWQWVSRPSFGASGGIWVVSDASDLSLISQFTGEFSITLLLFNITDGVSWKFLAVYGPNSNTIRQRFWAKLDHIAYLPHPIWCVGGAFNVVCWSHERNSSSSISPEMRDFSDFISHNELIDIPLQGCKFTGSNHSSNPPISKLDRFLISANWEEHFPRSLSMALPKLTLDHCPILLDTNAVNRGLRPFRFELHWLLEKDLPALVQSWWSSFDSQVSGRVGFVLQRKIQFLKRGFQILE
ncbi:hypothetical protein AMTRI_Chr12g267800 [Amborella trichopoda]